MNWCGAKMTNWTDDIKPPTFSFVDPSEKALTSPENKVSWFVKYVDYFEKCPVGKSFKIELIDVKESTLRPAVSSYNKKVGKQFKVILHETGYEVYRKR